MVTNQKKRKPKAGRYYVALAVGIRLEVYANLKTALARMGVYLKYTWTFGDSKDLGRRAIPPDVDVTIVVRETAISHSDRAAILYQAKQNNWGIDPAPGIAPTLRELERAGFGNMEPIILEDIEGPDPALTPSKETKPVAHPSIGKVPESINHPRLVVAPPEPKEPEPPSTVAPPPTPASTARHWDRPHLEAFDPRLVADGKILRAARLKTPYTGAMLGKILSMSASNITTVEQGRNAASDDVLEALERLYGLPVGTVPRRARLRVNAKARHAMNTRPEFLPKTPSGHPAPVILYEVEPESSPELTPKTEPKPEPEFKIEARIYEPPIAPPVATPTPVESPLSLPSAPTMAEVMVVCAALKKLLRTLKLTRIQITRSGINVDSEDTDE